MKKFFAVVKARTMEFVRDRGTFFWNLIFPILIVVGFSFAFSGQGEALFKVGYLQDPTSSLTPPQVQEFLELPGIEAIRYDSGEDLETLTDKIRKHQLDMLIVPQQGAYYINGEANGAQVLRRLIQSYLSTPQESPALSLNEESLNGEPIRYVDWLVPGVIGMNMMFSCLFGVGFVLVRYRKNGVLKRLKATPVGALNFLSAQAVSRMMIVIITSIFVFSATNLFLGFRMEGSYLDLLIVLLLGILSMITLGLIFASRLKSEELASGLMNLVTMPMLIFSGVFFSLEGTPEILQSIAKVFPLTHFLEAARGIMLDGKGLLELLPQLGFLGALTALFLGISSFTFKWE